MIQEPNNTDFVFNGLEDLKRKLSSEEKGTRIAALQQASNYGEKGLELVRQANIDDKNKLAINPHTSVEILRQLAWDDHKWLCRVVIKNPNVSDQIIQQLAFDEDWERREAITENPNTPAELLQQLANDLDPWVRCGVAQNSNTPIDTLRELAWDNNEYVKYKLSYNPKTPIEALQKLVAEAIDKDDVDIRNGVVSNPNTPVEILEQLVNDEEVNISEKAKEALKKRK